MILVDSYAQFISNRLGLHYKPTSKVSLDRSWGSQEFEAPRFQDNRHMREVRLSAPRTGCLYPTGNIPGTHFCWRLSRPMTGVRPESLWQWKLPIVPSGIEVTTLWLVVQCLNQLRHRVPKAEPTIPEFEWVNNLAHFRQRDRCNRLLCLPPS